MMTSSLSYNQFIESVEANDNFDCIEKMAYISKMRRRASSVSSASIYSQCSIPSSVCSKSSTKSAVPSAIDLNSAFYQKGFDLRQYDSDEDFDLVIGQGFHRSVGECMPTLKLTLTPELLRS